MAHAMLEELVYVLLQLRAVTSAMHLKTFCVKTVLCHFKLYTMQFTQLSSCKTLKAGSARINLA